MNAWKVILATMVIFVTGVVAGGLVVQRSLAARVSNPRKAAGEQHNSQFAGGMRLEFLRRAQKDLDLTPDQRERIDKILKASQERTKTIMEPVAPDLREEVKRAKREFLAVLTPEQQKTFDAFVKRAHSRENHHAPREASPEATSLTNSLEPAVAK